MDVTHRGANIRVPEQLLDKPQIMRLICQIRGDSVTNAVRRDWRFKRSAEALKEPIHLPFCHIDVPKAPPRRGE